jgi:hypothetical protein
MSAVMLLAADPLVETLRSAVTALDLFAAELRLLVPGNSAQSLGLASGITALENHKANLVGNIDAVRALAVRGHPKTSMQIIALRVNFLNIL